MGEIIRVLHVLGGLNRGGAETMIMNLYRHIDRSKVQFDFVLHTTDKCDYEDEVSSLGGRIHFVPRYTGKNHFKYKEAWRLIFESYSEYKIIHGHVRSTAAIYLKIAKKFRLVTIAHSHSISSGKGGKALIKNTLQYPIRYIADYRFACSEIAGEWLFGKRACREGNYFIIKNSIDINEFVFRQDIRNEVRGRLNIAGKLVIGHIGRFCTPKNHEFIIDIFKSLHIRNNNTVLLLVGEGELKSHIEKKVADLDLKDSVIFTGAMSDVSGYLHAMDVFLFPSLFEGLGMVLIEAQTSGLNCVVADTVPKEAFITDLVKVVSLSRSVEYWAETILQYNKNDLRKNMGNIVEAAGYAITDNSRKLEKFYIDRARKQ